MPLPSPPVPVAEPEESQASRYLASYTLPGSTYPSYVSINYRNTMVEITVRSPELVVEYTRAISTPVDPLEFWADLAEVLGHDRGEVNPASLVTEVSNRLVARSVDVERQVRETKDEGVQ
jgi:hypothetical protein